MWAHKTRVHVTPNQPLQVTLPADVPEGEAEVIVLMTESAGQQPGAAGTLREFSDWLAKQPERGRSKEEIDRYLAQERASWG
jgi:hypothetical protein